MITRKRSGLKMKLGLVAWTEPLWRCLPLILSARGYRVRFLQHGKAQEVNQSMADTLLSLDLLITEAYDHIVGGDSKGFRLAWTVLGQRMGPKVLLFFHDTLLPADGYPTFISYADLEGIFDHLQTLRSVSVDKQLSLMQRLVRERPNLIQLPYHP